MLSGAVAQAIEPAELFAIQRGPMLLKPQFNLSTVFNDNINYREENKLADVSAVISPGFALQIGARDYNFVEFSYFFDRIQYLQESNFDANQHRGAVEVHFQKSRFTIEGRDSVESLTSPLGGGISLEGQLVERFVVSDIYRLTYDLSERTGVYIGLNHTFNDYQEDLALYDSQTFAGTLGFNYKAFSRSFAFGEVYYGRTKNEPNVTALGEYPTASFVGGFLGARGNFTEKLSGTVKAGYEVRNYGDDSEPTQAPVVEANLTHQFTEATIATATYSRRQQESVQFVRSTYVSDVVSASLIQAFGAEGRLRGTLTGGYYVFTYEPNNAQFQFLERSDKLLTMGLTFSYDVKLWMRVLAGYNYERLTSNVASVADYTVNRITLGLELGY